LKEIAEIGCYYNHARVTRVDVEMLVCMVLRIGKIGRRMRNGGGLKKMLWGLLQAVEGMDDCPIMLGYHIDTRVILQGVGMYVTCMHSCAEDQRSDAYFRAEDRGHR